ncbi:MAG: FAD-binding oxidoreductase, partial [Planctomycetes bacterium]|nr:FAD-binding oxidoreductase [Planctomycetota bacterium]
MTNLAGQVVSPVDAAELISIVDQCRAAKVGIIATGGAAAPPPLPGDEGRCVVSFHQMNRIVAHDAQDLVVTLQPGLQFAELTATLADQGQRLAIESPAGHWSLGGLVAGRTTGFLRSSFGPPRDQVLGLQFVTSDGKLGKAGGRVVKNVTGYDLAKLFCSSHGSLGLLTEISLRLRPIPATTRTLFLKLDRHGDALALAADLKRLPNQISGLAILGGLAAKEHQAPCVLGLRLEGAAVAIADGEKRCAALHADFSTLEPEAAKSFWREATAFAEGQGFHTTLSMRPSRLEPAIDTMIRSAERARFGFVADPLGGHLSFTLPRPVRDVDTTVGQLLLGRLATDLEARVAIPSDPHDLLERHNRFGAPPAAVRALLQRVKVAFDPHGLMG